MCVKKCSAPKRLLKTYTEKYHQTQVFQFSCDVCDYKSNDENAFKIHEKNEHKDKFDSMDVEVNITDDEAFFDD